MHDHNKKKNQLADFCGCSFILKPDQPHQYTETLVSTTPSTGALIVIMFLLTRREYVETEHAQHKLIIIII